MLHILGISFHIPLCIVLIIILLSILPITMGVTVQMVKEGVVHINGMLMGTTAPEGTLIWEGLLGTRLCADIGGSCTHHAYQIAIRQIWTTMKGLTCMHVPRLWQWLGTCISLWCQPSFDLWYRAGSSMNIT